MITTRILLIDDKPSVTRTMKVNLERTGLYAGRTENQAAHALAAARGSTARRQSATDNSERRCLR